MKTEIIEYQILNKLKTENKKILIFGASRAGIYTLKVFRDLNIDACAFIDNDEKKYCDSYYGIPVLSPEAAIREFGDLNIFISMMSYTDLISIKKELLRIGFSNSEYGVHEIFDYYINNLTKRKFNKSLYREKQYNFYDRDSMSRDQTISPSITILVNERCNLKCQDCAALVPLNKDPITYSADTIIKALQNYCKSFDFVYRICIMGGEPFLHKEINKIFEAVMNLDNVLFIDIATNGTILPQSKTMDLINDLGATFEISDYGEVSRKMPQIIEECQKRNIVHFIQKYDFWATIGSSMDRKRDYFNRAETFIKCTKSIGITNHIVGEKLSRCIYSAMTSRLKLVPEFKGDHVNLCSEEVDLVDKVRKLTFRSQPLETCNYCLGIERDPIKAGIQIE